MRLGVDTGGTFTDFALLDGPGGIRVHKVPSTPEAPERAILRGIAELGLDPAGLMLVHGSTVATNAILEGRGAKTAFVTSHGFGDTLSIGRQARPHLYDLQPPPLLQPVESELCFECGGRVTPSGKTLEDLEDSEIEALCARVMAHAPEAVAISLLFSFVDDTNERRLEAAFAGQAFVSRSSEVLPEVREYERGIATWLNGRVGPLMAGYLGRLGDGLPGTRVAVMQSSAGTVDAGQAARNAVRLLLSGPAGGALAAAALGQAIDQLRLLTFDMGGTSTDVALVAGRPMLTNEGRVAGFPVAIPMVDIHTIGAGGGSIGWVDAGGALQVGPGSAGADPGPACYANGGQKATVTDAHVVLGHLPHFMPLGGTLLPDIDAARAAVAALGAKMGMDVESTARGIVRVADEHMAQALRVISVERGEDPKNHVLLPFGGAGGLHVCGLAQRLGMRRAVFPIYAGVLSAMGMLTAPATRTLSRTVVVAGGLEEIFRDLAMQGRQELEAEGFASDELQVVNAVSMRYVGQSYALEVEWCGDLPAAHEAFHELHERRYGHKLKLPVELVTAKTRVESPAPGFILPLREAALPASPAGTQLVAGIGDVPVYKGSELGVGQRLQGPLIVSSLDATLWLAEGWEAEVDRYGNLMLAS